jgi:hypothetical protein
MEMGELEAFGRLERGLRAVGNWLVPFCRLNPVGPAVARIQLVHAAA